MNYFGQRSLTAISTQCPSGTWIPMVGVFVRLGVDLGGKSRILQPTPYFVEIINLETKMVDTFLLVAIR